MILGRTLVLQAVAIFTDKQSDNLVSSYLIGMQVMNTSAILQEYKLYLLLAVNIVLIRLISLADSAALIESSKR